MCDNPRGGDSGRRVEGFAAKPAFLVASSIDLEAYRVGLQSQTMRASKVELVKRRIRSHSRVNGVFLRTCSLYSDRKFAPLSARFDLVASNRCLFRIVKVF